MKKIWKKGLSIMLSLAMAVSGFSGFAAEVQAEEAGKVTVVQEGSSVVIGNEYISREFSTADGTVKTVNITNKRTDDGDTVFTPAEGSEEFIIKLANQVETYGALDRTNWTATTNSYEDATAKTNGNALNLIDGDLSSFWHTAYKNGPGPKSYDATDSDGQSYYVLFDLGGEQTFQAFSYTPRQDSGTNGNILGYELYKTDSEETLAANAEGWKLISSGDFPYNGKNTIYVNFDEEQTATQLKFVPKSAQNGGNFAGGAEFNLHAEKVNKIKVACVGDSLTEGLGSSSGKKSETAYPAYLQNLLGSDYDVRNFGRSSMTIMKGTGKSYWDTTEYKQSISYKPDIVIIMLGTNDSKHVFWNEEQFREDAVALMEQYEALESKPRIIFAVSPQCYCQSETDIDREEVAVMAEVQKKLIAENDWESVDMYQKTEGKESLYKSDGVHFTDAGYLYIAECMYEAIGVEPIDKTIAASELTLKGVESKETTATINDVEKTGQMITFTFKDYTFQDTTFTITENIVMYDGDHYMRKYMEISVAEEIEEGESGIAIDYIDLESLKVNEDDVTWTIPTTGGDFGGMNRFKANLGQPIYIDGMFFGCEFPETDTEIVEGTGYMRYYTGKTFDRFKKDNQLTTDGKYVTWQTVAGAARSTDNQVIQADFFEYIYDIATPSEFRIQYNSWFDNMKYIDDENILESFIEIDRELNKAEVRPLDSYVVDDGWVNYNDGSIWNAAISGTTINESGFWDFNSKFPNGFTPSSELVHKFGSDFGVWVGPRGGYGGTAGHIANIVTQSGKGSTASGRVDVADRTYVENFTEMACKYQDDYGINYWKWDGFADNGLYNTFAATDAIPGYANRHMTGGYQNMYNVTDLWEAWIDLFEAVRANADKNQIEDLWISITCYVNLSPWFLQWVNSVWIQNSADQSDAGSSSSKMDRQMTYRDSKYYDMLVTSEYQFPLSNVYNHDPIYGKEGTGMTIDSATDEQFQNYLYMQSTRGSSFWELYLSDSIMTDGKYEIFGEFLEWAEENHHILKNAKMFGDSPAQNCTYAYGYACFDGTDGIISVRNPSTNAKSVTLTFDRTIGVPEDAGTLQYHMEHSHNLTEGTPTTGTFTYGEEYTFTLQPDEVRMFRISKTGDTAVPQVVRAYADGAKEVVVKFDEKVTGQLFEIEGAKISKVTQSADDATYHITLAEAPEDGTTLTVKPLNIKDLAGNACANEISFVYHTDNVVAEGAVAAEESLSGINGFTVKATVETAAAGTLVAQGDVYALGINDDGKATFTLNGATAVSDVSVSAGDTIVGVKENNGILKIYVNGTVAGAAYNEENRYYNVEQAAITVANATDVTVLDTALGYDAVAETEEETSTATNLALGVTNLGAKWVADDTDCPKVSDRSWELVTNGKIECTNHSYKDFGENDKNAYFYMDLGEAKLIESINLYRFWNDKRIYGGMVVAVSENEDFSNPTILYNSDADNVLGFGKGTDETYQETSDGATFKLDEAVRAQYVRIYVTQQNHFIEVEVMGHDIQATNLALRKGVTVVARYTADGKGTAKENKLTNSETGAEGDRPMSWVVNDEYTSADSYAEFGKDNSFASRYCQIDLGGEYDIDGINMYRYWTDSRMYPDTVIAIAKNEEDFANGNATIVYNADDGLNSAGENVEVEEGKGIHGLGIGTDADYTETSEGKSWDVADGTTGRYVRVYMYGYVNSQKTASTNHIVEVQVMGIAPAEVEPDEENGADLSALIARLAALEAIDKTPYTEESVEAFNALLAPAYAMIETGAEKADDVTAMLTSLKDAESVLKENADYTKVDEALEKVDDLNRELYTAESLAKVDKAVKAVVRNKNADEQSAVNAMAEAIEAALKDLELKGADYTAVEKALKSVPADLSVYTDETAKAVTDAVGKVEEGKNLTEQETVNEWAEAIIAAVKALQYKPAAYDAVNDALAKVPADLTIYTKESVDALNEAIAAVENDKNITEQDTINAWAQAILDAIEALEKIPEEPSVEENEVVRIAGADRYETGFKVADDYKKALGVEKFDSVIIATGKNFADALSGSYLAIVKNAPILLTNGKADNVAQLHAYIAENLKEKGNIYILGGEAAVPASVEAGLEGYAVKRLAGESRYDTNLEILEEAGVSGTELLVATGKTFADSLSASATGRPILLVKPGAELTNAQKAVAEKVAGGTIYVLGGAEAVSEETANAFSVYGEVKRLSGADRYETSAAVAETFFGDAKAVVIASGRNKNFPDGLCGGPLAAALNVPLILTKDGQTEAATGYVAEHEVNAGYALGGESALTDETVKTVFGLKSVDEIIVK